MPIDVTLLKTRADCDKATAAYEDRLATLTKQQSDVAYSAKVATKRALGYNDELTDLVAGIAGDDAVIPTLTPDSDSRLKREDRRRKANDRREEVLALQRDLGGVEALMRQSELKETERRIASLREDSEEVARHKETLAA